jgi:hypothetical protein
MASPAHKAKPGGSSTPPLLLLLLLLLPTSNNAPIAHVPTPNPSPSSMP